MKQFNGAIVSKPLKDVLEKVLVPLEEKIDESTANAMEFRGAYNISTQYHTNDVVAGYGVHPDTYIALKDNINRQPSVSPDVWRKIAITHADSTQGLVNNVTLEVQNAVIINDGAIEDYRTIPEAIFIGVIEGQTVVLRIVKFNEDTPDTMLSSAVISNANSAIIYSLVANKNNESFLCYKTTLSASGASTVAINPPANLTAHFRIVNVAKKS